MEATRQFMLRHARPLDWARWRFHFEGGSAQDVMAALAAYQNADGGFAHGLEADCWSAASAPMQVWAATRVMREIGWQDGAHHVVRGAVRYLMSGDCFDEEGWWNQAPGNASAPHAPWWTPTLEGMRGSMNPTASLAGFVGRWGEDAQALKLGRRLAGACVSWLMAQERVTDMHVLACFLDLMEDAAQVPDHLGLDLFRMARKLGQLASGCVCRDTAQWATGYVCRPSALLRSRDSVLYPALAELAKTECAFLRESRGEDGAWPVNWQWSDYPAEWAVARVWWQGDLAVRNALFLRHFDAAE